MTWREVSHPLGQGRGPKMWQTKIGGVLVTIMDRHVTVPEGWAIHTMEGGVKAMGPGVRSLAEAKAFAVKMHHRSGKIWRAIQAIRPGALFSLIDPDDLKTLQWLDPLLQKPTEEELAAIMAAY